MTMRVMEKRKGKPVKVLINLRMLSNLLFHTSL